MFGWVAFPIHCRILLLVTEKGFTLLVLSSVLIQQGFSINPNDSSLSCLHSPHFFFCLVFAILTFSENTFAV